MKSTSVFAQREKDNLGSRPAIKFAYILVRNGTYSFSEIRIYDTNGKLVKINTKAGQKYMLVDFWASWCIPCRKENPLMAIVYDKYRKSGLALIGISVDDNIEAWLEAIKKDQLQWSQLRGNSQTYDNYLFKAIPANYLLDQQGKVVAKNLSAAELDLFLSARLNLR